MRLTIEEMELALKELRTFHNPAAVLEKMLIQARENEKQDILLRSITGEKSWEDKL